MTFFIAAAALFVALLAGTAIEFPRLCCGGWDGIELSQARATFITPMLRPRLSSSSVFPWDYSCTPESFTSLALVSTTLAVSRNPA